MSIEDWIDPSTTVGAVAVLMIATAYSAREVMKHRRSPKAEETANAALVTAAVSDAETANSLILASLNAKQAEVKQYAEEVRRVRKDNAALRRDNRELHKQLSERAVEIADLRIELAELSARLEAIQARLPHIEHEANGNAERKGRND